MAALLPLPEINGERDAAAAAARLRELEVAFGAAGDPSERSPLASEIVRLRAALAAYRLRAPAGARASGRFARGEERDGDRVEDREEGSFA